MAAPSPSPELRHVAMLPFMAKGHAMPLLHLARLLLSRRLASAITLFTTPRNAPFVRAGLAGTAPVVVVELPFPSDDAPQSMDELPSASSDLVGFLSSVAVLRPAFAAALAGLEPRPDVLVHDAFLPWAMDAADELGVPRLVTHGMGAFASYVSVVAMEHRPHAREGSPSEQFPVRGVPGLRLTKADLSPPFDEPEPAGPLWDVVCESRKCVTSSRGIIANSFHDLESIYMDVWNRELPVKMWPVGPLCLASGPVHGPVQAVDQDILVWLESRLAMDRPVLYVAFGSQAELSRAQLEEIAVGLDRSGLDFLWVVRSKWLEPDDRLEDRFGDRGKVVQAFINQLKVLGHQATKGFFSHCGWNSVLESISMGVPMLALPMAAEQKLNAKFMVEEAQVGLRVWPKECVDTEGKDGLVVSEDVQALTRELICGEEGRRAAARASELSLAARKAMEVGGSSYENLEMMVREIDRSGQDKC